MCVCRYGVLYCSLIKLSAAGWPQLSSCPIWASHRPSRASAVRHDPTRTPSQRRRIFLHAWPRLSPAYIYIYTYCRASFINSHCPLIHTRTHTHTTLGVSTFMYCNQFAFSAAKCVFLIDSDICMCKDQTRVAQKRIDISAQSIHFISQHTSADMWLVCWSR